MLARADRPIARSVGLWTPARGWLVAGFVGWGLVLRRALETLG